MKLVGLSMYPLKSGAGIALERWPLAASGLLYDRRFMLVDPAGDFVSLRGHPRLVRVRSTLLPTLFEAQRVRFEHDGMLALEVALESRAEPEEIEVQIWGDFVAANPVSSLADAWFSEVVGKDVRLVRFDDAEHRQVELEYARAGDSVHFADAYPLLLTGTASLRALSEAMGHEVPMARFRPNLVVETDEPYVEDRWRTIRIGEVEVDLPKPCARCVGINADPATGKSSKEPLATLAKSRTIGGKVLFGQNAIHRGVGVLSLGDPVEVVAEGA